MEQAFIDEMKQKLTEELEDLKTELKAVSNPDNGDHFPGDRDPKFTNYGDDALDANDQSPMEVEDYAVNVSVTGPLQQKLNEVEAALRRIQDGTYGICSKSGKTIPEDRLRANPAAATCIDGE